MQAPGYLRRSFWNLNRRATGWYSLGQCHSIKAAFYLLINGRFSSANTHGLAPRGRISKTAQCGEMFNASAKTCHITGARYEWKRDKNQSHGHVASCGAALAKACCLRRSLMEGASRRPCRRKAKAARDRCSLRSGHA
jgi:hypothetical protein